MADRESFAQVPGGKCWFAVAGAEKPSLPLVTVHGGPGVSHDDLAPLRTLSDERPVVFYDQLGGGRSDRPVDERLWRVERFVDELDCVRAAAGLDRFHLFGQSWGTVVALEYALAQAGRVATLILASPYVSMPRARQDIIRLRRALPSAVRAALDQLEAGGLTGSRQYRALVREFTNRHLVRAAPWPEPVTRSMATFNAPVLHALWGKDWLRFDGPLVTHDRLDRLAELRMPVLLTCGRFDQVPADTVDLYRSRIPRAETAVFDESAHYAHAEEPDRFAAVVRSFLSRSETLGCVSLDDEHNADRQVPQLNECGDAPPASPD